MKNDLLDDLAYLFGVTRKFNESDDDLRRRIKYDGLGFDRPNGLTRAIYKLEENEKEEN